VRIGCNLLYLLPGIVGGTQTYAVSLIRALAALDDDAEYVVYVNREAAALEIVDDPKVRTVVCDVMGRSRPRRYAFEQLRLPSLARRDGIDLLHSFAYVGPLRAPCPHVVTMHDLIYVGFRDHMPARRRWALRVFARGAGRRADRIITVSEASKSQIVDDMGLTRDRVTVIHEAGRPVPDRSVLHDRSVPAAHGIDGPYVVAFSSLSPSKNIPRLIEAFARVAPATEASLVLIGHVPKDADLQGLIRRAGLAGRVVITGFVPDDHVLPLMAQATVFAMPSVYEGFGLPVLDAQAVGVPVVCSAAASLPEVAGDGALLFDPGSTEEIAAALRRCLSDTTLRDSLVTRGSANLARFSWDRAAEQTRQVYREVAGR
jgi:glycosyltransferase involved in cell wall biosynthesis